MSDASGAVWLIDSETGAKLIEPPVVNNEVFMPEGYAWVWCLDGRIEPYNELPLEDVLKRAATNRKRYVLVNDSQLGGAAAPQADEEDEASDD